MPDKEMTHPTGHPWEDFLHYRRIALEHFLAQGHTASAVAEILGIDSFQVTLIHLQGEEAGGMRPTAPGQRASAWGIRRKDDPATTGWIRRKNGELLWYPYRVMAEFELSGSAIAGTADDFEVVEFTPENCEEVPS